MMRKLTMAAGFFLLLATALISTATPRPAELLSAGRVDDAIRELKAELQSSPSDAAAYNLLARAYYSLQRWDDAISAAQRSVALVPNNSDYHLWLGRAYGEKAERSSWLSALSLARKVRAEFERAVQLDSSNWRARSDLSEFYLEAPGFLGGSKEKALVQASQLEPAHPGIAHWVRARLAEKEKNYKLAEQEFRAAIQSGKTRAENWLSLAAFLSRRGRFMEMEDAINKAVAVPSEERDSHPLYDAAVLLFRTGRNIPGAIELVRSYLSGGSSSEEAPLFQAHYLLGSILEKQGNRSGAAEQYGAALALAKDFAPAQAGLKRVQ